MADTQTTDEDAAGADACPVHSVFECRSCGEEKPLTRFRGGEAWHSLTCARCEGQDPKLLDHWEEWLRDEEPMEEGGDPVVADVLAGAAARIRELEARVEAGGEAGGARGIVLTGLVAIGCLVALVVGVDPWWLRLAFGVITVLSAGASYVLWIFDALERP